jgi:dissimilatory sulfite reductase (desulfoviridin) alpha/beta subunit
MNPAKLMQRLAQTLDDSGYSKFMETRALGPNIRHKSFTVSLAGCPHECSQPLVHDFGVIGRSFVIREYGEGPESVCTECGECVNSCREDALQLIGGEPDIDYTACIGCGDCVRACDRELLIGQRSGYSVVVGGRLGRHPKFAQEVMLLGSEDEIEASLRICLERYMADSEDGERFSDFVERVGIESIRQSIEEGMREAREDACEMKEASNG